MDQYPRFSAASSIEIGAVETFLVATYGPSVVTRLRKQNRTERNKLSCSAIEMYCVSQNGGVQMLYRPREKRRNSSVRELPPQSSRNQSG